MASECSSGLFSCDRVVTCLSSPQSGNSSTSCSGQTERGDKEKFDLHEWMKFVFLDDADEVCCCLFVCK